MEDQIILKTKNKIINIALFWFSIISIPVVFLSVNRWRVTGWTLVYYVQIGFALTILILYFLRNHLTFHKKAALFCLVYGITGVLSFMTFGLIANGLIVLLSVSLFSSLLFNLRIGLISTSLFLLSIIIIGYLHVSGKSKVSFDINILFYSTQAWINASALFILNSLTLIFSQDILSKAYKKTITELIESKEQLTKHNLKLNKLNKDKETLLKNNSNLISQLRTIINNSIQRVLLLDLEGNIHLMDKRNKESVKELWNIHHEKINFREIFSQKVLKLIEEKFNIATKGNTTRFEFNHIFPTGKNRWIDAVFVPIKDSSGDIQRVVYSSVDITDKKNAASKVLHSAIQSEEKERSRIAQELHDGLGPLLSTLKLYYESLVHTNDDKLKEKIQPQISETIDDALNQVSSISNNLSPHILRNFGFKSALERYVSKIEKLNKVQIEYTIDDVGNLNSEIEITLYRVLTELINNTLKYANASTIKFTLRLNDLIHLEYFDDGIGFNFKETIALQKGMGLFNLKNRIESFNGSICMDNKENGQGIHYIISLPLILDEQREFKINRS